MRIRALDVRTVRIDGRSIVFRACTLAARTSTDGSHTWEASGWLRGREPASELGQVVPVSLETDDGTLSGSAFVSLGSAGGSHAAGAPFFLVGVGRLDPWPG